jgi:antitoxin MazE
MRAQIGKWGNSLALRIPSSLAQEAALQEGSPVNVSIDGGRVVVTPVVAEPVVDLEQLVAGITPENRHEEYDFGKAVGNEFS